MINGQKVALIAGVTGQDGAYLSRLLLEKGYIVHGIQRRSSLPNTTRIDEIVEPRHNANARFILHYGDMTDTSNLNRILRDAAPDEIYNLAAQSSVDVSFETPEYTANADALGTLRMLEGIRLLRMEEKVRYYQASTAEMYGAVREIPQTETTPFYPRSPYGAAKAYAFWTVINYRESYGMHASNGILFNHESPIRGVGFLTRKVTKAVAAIKLGSQETVYLGNLDASRDWGDARDYVKGMWLMLQQDKPDDYVLATGVTTKVRTFVEWAFEEIGVTLQWEGEGIEEKGYCAETGRCRVALDPYYFRPAEVDFLLGDPTKAKEKLGWVPETTPRDLVREMVHEDLKSLGEEMRFNM